MTSTFTPMHVKNATKTSSLNVTNAARNSSIEVQKTNTEKDALQNVTSVTNAQKALIHGNCATSMWPCARIKNATIRVQIVARAFNLDMNTIVMLNWFTSREAPVRTRSDPNDAPWISSEGEVNQDLADAYQAEQDLILAQSETETQPRVYNLPVRHDVQLHQVIDFVSHIWSTEQHAFRINLQFGYILRDRETGRYRYFKPIFTQGFFDHPFRISSSDDIEDLRRRLESMDFIQHVLNQRPNTKWELELLTNLQATIYPLDFVAGNTPICLPRYIVDSKSIMGLDYDKMGVPYSDSLCLFRCLASHRGGSTFTESDAKSLFAQWLAFSRTPESAFHGVSFEDIPYFEECFNVSVMVYCLGEDMKAVSLYRSPQSYDDTMYLNLFDNHFSYITNIDAYCRRFKCTYCGMLFSKRWCLTRHQKSCSAKSKSRFPGGYYGRKESIFDEAETLGIFVPQDKRHNPFIITYDMKAKVTETEDKISYLAEHQPISVAIASTVPGFEDIKCFLRDDGDVLIKSMTTYMTEIAEATQIMLHERWHMVFSKLADLMALWKPDEPDENEEEEDREDEDLIDLLESDVYNGNDEPANTKEEAIQSVFEPGNMVEIESKIKKSMYRRIKFFKGKFERFMMRVPTLGFNSSLYDINLSIRHLIRHFQLNEKKKVNIVKRGSKYMALTTDRFRFLDILNYLPPNTTYSEFLKAFGIPEPQGKFPYEYIDSFAKLHEKELPPIGDAWFSRLRGRSLLEDEHNSIENHYANSEDIWEENDMETLGDYLAWHQTNRTHALLRGVEKLREYYVAKGICAFTSAISVSGCARQLLFRAGLEAGGMFALFDENNKDLYATFKQNIFGGPSKNYSSLMFLQ